NNSADRTRMAAFIDESAAAGATGIGHAAGYMGTQSTHIGGGMPVAVWGTGNSRSGAPAWVIEAFERGRGRALSTAQVAAGLAQMRQAATNGVPPPAGAEETSVEHIPVLATVRKQFADEVHDPEIRRLLAASADAEVGGQGSDATQYYLETVFNRAAARNRTLKRTVTDTAYYPETTTSKLGRTFAPAVQARIDEIIDGIMAGANESNFATGNESGDIHSGGAPVTRD